MLTRTVAENSLTFASHQGLSETQGPSVLGGRVGNLVLAKFHLEVRQFPAEGVEWNTVVQLRVKIVWLIVPHSYVAGLAQSSEHTVGKAAVEMDREGNLPGSYTTGERRRHGVNGNDDGRRTPRLALQQDRFDRVMLRAKPAFDAGRPGGCSQMQVAGDRRSVAHFRYEVRGVEMAVAVDHQARGSAEYGWGIEDFRQRLRDARRADIPCNVAREFGRRQAEVVQFRRNVTAGVIAEKDETASRPRAKNSRRRHTIVTPRLR